MSKWEFRMDTEHLYLTAESENKSLLKDIEEAVNNGKIEENVSEKYKVCKEYSEFSDKELSRKWSN